VNGYDGRRQVWTPGGDLFDVRIVRHGLPIGNLTSQFFANVYLNPLASNRNNNNPTNENNNIGFRVASS